MSLRFRLGALSTDARRWCFRVWAPHATQVNLHLVAPKERLLPMRSEPNGYWSLEPEGVQPGARYFYRIDEGPDRPDPSSRFQPDGVHEASEVVDPEYSWKDANWRGVPSRHLILYELHVGTFSAEGTFDGVAKELPRLLDLGITAIELMPVAQFPGSRNWGYDGVNLFAVHNSYGGPVGLKRLIDACHRAGLAVVLDVVYNHLGPEGNYLSEFGPYFNEFDQTLWGPSLNFHGPQSGEVRRLFLENALYWQREFHLDGLRLDAVHAIRDFSAIPFLQDLARLTQREAEDLSRPFWLVAESDLNDPRLVRPEANGGFGIHAQWSDDFHHCLHVLLTGEQQSYYQDYGGVAQLAKVFRHGYAFTGEYSRHRRRPHGAPATHTSSKQFVVYAQNHDQVGNRARGDRLTRLVPFESLKLAAGAVVLSPFLPLLFMGEEYGELAPFQYVTSHSDPKLVEAVRAGRRREFEAMHGSGTVPDPQSEAVFLENKLNPELADNESPRRLLLAFYRELIRLRKEMPAVAEADKETTEVQSVEAHSALLLHYTGVEEEVLVVLCFAEEQVEVALEIPKGTWHTKLDSAATCWGGPGSEIPSQITDATSLRLNPKSLVLFHRLPPAA